MAQSGREYSVIFSTFFLRDIIQAVVPGYYLEIKPLKMLNDAPQASFCISLEEQFGKSWNSLDGIKFYIHKAHL